MEQPKRKLSLTVELLKTSSTGDWPKPSESRQCSSHAHKRFIMWMGQKTRLELLSDMSSCAFDKETRKGSRHSSSPILENRASFLGTPGCTTFNRRSTGEKAQLTGPCGPSNPSSGSWHDNGERRPLHRSTAQTWPRNGPLKQPRNARQKTRRSLRSIATTRWYFLKWRPTNFRCRDLRIM
jgi:hypothetical protein